MLRADLQAAGIPVEVEGPEGTETRDFHALRAVFISNVIRSGADLKQAMTLARYSDPRLTTARYTRTRIHDLGDVVNRLSSVQFGSRTGAAPGAADFDDERGQTRTIGEQPAICANSTHTPKPLILQGIENDSGQSARSEREARAGIEPANNGFANASETPRKTSLTPCFLGQNVSCSGSCV